MASDMDIKDIRINEPDDAITDVSLRVCKVLDNISQTQRSYKYSVQLVSLIVNGLYSGFVGSADVEFQLVGSVGEGCPIISSSKSSDHDLMYVMNTCQAYEHSVVCVPKHHWQFYMEQCDINPCYVRLRVMTRGSSPKLFNNLPGIFSFESKLSRHYLSNAIPATINNLFALPTFGFLKDEKIVAGPSLTHTVTGLSPYNTVDTVISIRCPAWPAVAEEWINRRRYYHLPSRCFIEEHVKHGCHVVPVGCKECEHTYLDWRLSFVLVEQALVSEFNATQLKCYLLLKHLKKFTFEEEIDDMISSYILKTTLFWVIEESPPDLWVPRRLLTAVQMCLDRLITAIRTDFCPNYFIRNSNLFARRYKVVEKQTVLHICVSARENIMLCLCKTSPFNEMLHREDLSLDSLDFDNIETITQSKMTSAILHIVKNTIASHLIRLLLLHQGSVETVIDNCTEAVNKVTNVCLKYGLQSKEIVDITCDVEMFSRRLSWTKTYLDQKMKSSKQWMPPTIMTTTDHIVGDVTICHMNAAVGNITLCNDQVTVLVEKLRQVHCLHPLDITNKGLLECLTDINGIYFEWENQSGPLLTDIVFLRFEIDFLPEPLKMEISSLGEFSNLLGELSGTKPILAVDPVVYACFLKFWCCMKLERNIDMLKARDDMVWCCSLPDITNKAVAFNLLGYCHKQLEEYDAAFKAFQVAFRQSPASEATLIHISSLVNFKLSSGV